MSRIRLAMVAALGLVTLVGVLRLGAWTNEGPTSCDDPPRLNIIAIEFAGTADRARDLLDTPCAAELLHHQLHRDGLFIAVYVVAIGGWSAWGARHFRRPWLRGAGRLAVVAGALAGLFDVVENAFLDRVANGDFGAAVWATVFTVPKWLLVVPAMVYATAAVVLAVILVGRSGPWPPPDEPR